MVYLCWRLWHKSDIYHCEIISSSLSQRGLTGSTSLYTVYRSLRDASMLPILSHVTVLIPNTPCCLPGLLAACCLARKANSAQLMLEFISSNSDLASTLCQCRLCSCLLTRKQQPWLQQKLPGPLLGPWPGQQLLLCCHRKKHAFQQNLVVISLGVHDSPSLLEWRCLRRHKWWLFSWHCLLLDKDLDVCSLTKILMSCVERVTNYNTLIVWVLACT